MLLLVVLMLLLMLLVMLLVLLLVMLLVLLLQDRGHPSPSIGGAAICGVGGDGGCGLD